MSAKKNSTGKTIRRIILIIFAAILLLVAIFIGVVLVKKRPALQPTETYQEIFSDTEIKIANDNGVSILPRAGGACKAGIIFYVGAQIEPSAYIPLLARLAQHGYACFIPKLTSNMASMEQNAADQIIGEHPEIKTWYLAGHSMGGYTASGYVDDHRNDVDGLILIAAYTSRDLSDTDIPMLSVYGDNDGVLNKGRYEKSKNKNSRDFEEHILAGANHAQFGDYGKQPRDYDATISAEDQQRQTAEIILDWLERKENS